MKNTLDQHPIPSRPTFRQGQPACWMLKALALAASAALLVSSVPLRAPAAPVTVREENTVIPTYLAGAPEPNPMFFFGRSSQGAQAPSYPYPMYDVLTGIKADKTYKMVYLEHEYLRIGILPGIGGRILEGLDKTDNYNF